MLDYIKLEYLRSHTIINPIDKLKIHKMKAEAIKDANIINEAENCNIGVDFKKADFYEYAKRFNAWIEKVLSAWKENTEGLSLVDYANIALDKAILKEREEVYERQIKWRTK